MGFLDFIFKPPKPPDVRVTLKNGKVVQASQAHWVGDGWEINAPGVVTPHTEYLPFILPGNMANTPSLTSQQAAIDQIPGGANNRERNDIAGMVPPPGNNMLAGFMDLGGVPPGQVDSNRDRAPASGFSLPIWAWIVVAGAVLYFFMKKR